MKKVFALVMATGMVAAIVLGTTKAASVDMATGQYSVSVVNDLHGDIEIKLANEGEDAWTKTHPLLGDWTITPTRPIEQRINVRNNTVCEFPCNVSVSKPVYSIRATGITGSPLVTGDPSKINVEARAEDPASGNGVILYQGTLADLENATAVSPDNPDGTVQVFFPGNKDLDGSYYGQVDLIMIFSVNGDYEGDVYVPFQLEIYEAYVM